MTASRMIKPPCQETAVETLDASKAVHIERPKVGTHFDHLAGRVEFECVDHVDALSGAQRNREGKGSVVAGGPCRPLREKFRPHGDRITVESPDRADAHVRIA